MRHGSSARWQMKRHARTLGVGLALGALVVPSDARADVVRVDAVACRTAADAQTVVALQAKRDKVGAAAVSRPLVASGSCIDLAKGIQVDIDERRAPLMCVRLTGDLSCYWLPAAFVDEHPGEKGSAGGGRRGGRRR